MCISIRCEFSCALGEVFFFASRILGSKCKNQLFEENKGFECSVYQIEVQLIINLSN